MELSDQDVTNFLCADPEFFCRNAHLLTEIMVPSQHGGAAVSLVERQQIAHREKIRALEFRLAELVQFGKENDAISERVHRLSLGLLAADNLDALVGTITRNISTDFQVPHVTCRLWARPLDGDDASNEEFRDVGQAMRDWADGLVRPHCGNDPGLGVRDCFGENGTMLKSYAIVALRGEAVFGLLLMASESEQRFYPEMGTLYLNRIGELVSVSLMRYLE